MADDWVGDESMSREETLARFRSLNPQPTRDIPHPKQLTCAHMTIGPVISARCPICGPMKPGPVNTTSTGRTRWRITDGPCGSTLTVIR